MRWIVITATALLLSLLLLRGLDWYAGKSATIAEKNCRENEEAGYIPPGSCACSEQLFTSWDRSYNWMDACAIVEAKQRGGETE